MKTNDKNQIEKVVILKQTTELLHTVSILQKEILRDNDNLTLAWLSEARSDLSLIEDMINNKISYK